MMQGYVLTFRPETGDGTIITGGGKAIRFRGLTSPSSLAGGDVVTFEACPGKGATMDGHNLQVVQHSSECPSTTEQAQIREFLKTVRMSRSARAPVHVK